MIKRAQGTSYDEPEHQTILNLLGWLGSSKVTKYANADPEFQNTAKSYLKDMLAHDPKWFRRNDIGEDFSGPRHYVYAASAWFDAEDLTENIVPLIFKWRKYERDWAYDILENSGSRGTVAVMETLRRQIEGPKVDISRLRYLRFFRYVTEVPLTVQELEKKMARVPEEQPWSPHLEAQKWLSGWTSALFQRSELAFKEPLTPAWFRAGFKDTRKSEYTLIDLALSLPSYPDMALDLAELANKTQDPKLASYLKRAANILR